MPKCLGLTRNRWLINVINSHNKSGKQQLSSCYRLHWERFWLNHSVCSVHEKVRRGDRQISTAQFNKHRRRMRGKKVNRLSGFVLFFYLDVLQKLHASTSDVFKRTPSGEHEKVNQDVVQVAARRVSWGRGQGGHGCYRIDGFHSPGDVLADGFQRLSPGAGVSAAQSVPSPHSVLVLHLHRFTLLMLVFYNKLQTHNTHTVRCLLTSQCL